MWEREKEREGWEGGRRETKRERDRERACLLERGRERKRERQTERDRDRERREREKEQEREISWEHKLRRSPHVFKRSGHNSSMFMTSLTSVCVALVGKKRKTLAGKSI